MHLQKKRKILLASVEETPGKKQCLDHNQDVETTTISSSSQDKDPILMFKNRWFALLPLSQVLFL